MAGVLAAIGMVSLGVVPAHATPGDEQTSLPTVDADLTAMAHRQSAPPARTALAAAATDATGDGIDDVFTRQLAAGRIDLHAGTGVMNGTATLAAPVQVRATTPDRVWFGQGDLDGDGRSDIASINGAGVMHAAFNQGTVNGVPQFSADVPFLYGSVPGHLTLLSDYVGNDPDNPLELDGLADIIIKNLNTNSIDLYVNYGVVNGAPSFSYWGALLNDAGPDYVTDINLADLTSDYFKEILITQVDGTLWALDIFAEVDSGGNPVAKWFKIVGSGMNSADFVLFPDFNIDEYPDFAVRFPGTGEFRGVLHSKNWNPAQPEAVFDSSTGQLLKRGWSAWSGYNAVF